MICCKCGEVLDFASNPIGKIIRFSPNDTRYYCKPCNKKFADKLGKFDLTVLEDG